MFPPCTQLGEEEEGKEGAERKIQKCVEVRVSVVQAEVFAGLSLSPFPPLTLTPPSSLLPPPSSLLPPPSGSHSLCQQCYPEGCDSEYRVLPPPPHTPLTLPLGRGYQLHPLTASHSHCSLYTHTPPPLPHHHYLGHVHHLQW